MAKTAGNCGAPQFPTNLGPNPRIQAFRNLHDRGAHFVLADTQKRPIGKGWQK